MSHYDLGQPIEPDQCAHLRKHARRVWVWVCDSCGGYHLADPAWVERNHPTVLPGGEEPEGATDGPGHLAELEADHTREARSEGH